MSQFEAMAWELAVEESENMIESEEDLLSFLDGQPVGYVPMTADEMAGYGDSQEMN